ncbi:hypothetical protein DFH09DRAFT_1078730 [Mycena vulgaris]|nr:hypothetical protein DFH09DRAFT_1078730 [Mycena vulgaris]
MLVENPSSQTWAMSLNKQKKLNLEDIKDPASNPHLSNTGKPLSAQSRSPEQEPLPKKTCKAAHILENQTNLVNSDNSEEILASMWLLMLHCAKGDVRLIVADYMDDKYVEYTRFDGFTVSCMERSAKDFCNPGQIPEQHGTTQWSSGVLPGYLIQVTPQVDASYTVPVTCHTVPVTPWLCHIPWHTLAVIVTKKPKLGPNRTPLTGADLWFWEELQLDLLVGEICTDPHSQSPPGIANTCWYSVPHGTGTQLFNKKITQKNLATLFLRGAMWTSQALQSADYLQQYDRTDEWMEFLNKHDECQTAEWKKNKGTGGGFHGVGLSTVFDELMRIHTTESRAKAEKEKAQKAKVAAVAAKAFETGFEKLPKQKYVEMTNQSQL